MKSLLKRLWEDKTLFCLLVIAFLARIIAIFFAKGFGMHDDHFLVIEASQSWVDGFDYNYWLPWSKLNTGPDGHNFFYVGIHFILFIILKWIHIFNPQNKMIIIRLIHALWSLLIVKFGYKITLKLSDKKAAIQVGLMLALLWIFPWLSVRNLVEVVSIPFLMWGMWLLIKEENIKTSTLIWVGFLFGLAFTTRFQTLMFISSIGLVFLIRRQWNHIIYVVFGFCLSIFIFEGIIDLIFWGKPFAETLEYLKYNMTHSKDYIISSWYTYLLFLLGVLIPPVSIALFIGFFRTWKKHLLFFLPTFLFLIFHSTFPNKQERFILTIVPFFIILGIVGRSEFIAHKPELYLKSKKLIKAALIFFWTINFILLFVFSFHYSKRSRVESMTYLSKYKNVQMIMMENTNATDTKMPPLFYLGQWVGVLEISKTKNLDSLKLYLNKYKCPPRFILFEGDKYLNARVDSLKKILPNIESETVVKPGLIDDLVYKLNPINVNQTIYIYRNKDYFPSKID